MNLAPIAAQELERTTETCYYWTYFRLVSTFDLAPFSTSNPAGPGVFPEGATA
jgi:hypothetical protein